MYNDFFEVRLKLKCLYYPTTCARFFLYTAPKKSKRFNLKKNPDITHNKKNVFYRRFCQTKLKKKALFRSSNLILTIGKVIIKIIAYSCASRITSILSWIYLL